MLNYLKFCLTFVLDHHPLACSFLTSMSLIPCSSMSIKRVEHWKSHHDLHIWCQYFWPSCLSELEQFGFMMASGGWSRGCRLLAKTWVFDITFVHDLQIQAYQAIFKHSDHCLIELQVHCIIFEKLLWLLVKYELWFQGGKAQHCYYLTTIFMQATRWFFCSWIW